MRTILTITLAVALSTVAACGKKKAPATPGNTATEGAPAAGAADSNEEKNMATPDKGDESAPKSSDPCEGGE
jgi:hypothetical protein